MVLRANSFRTTSSALTSSLAVFCSFLLSACGSVEDTSSVEAVFVPPPPAVATAPTLSVPFLAADAPTPTLACVNSLRFLADITIPDGTEVEAGAVLDKVWEVENSGTCNWDERYRLKLIGGADLGAKPEQALYPARSGAQFQIRIRFTAPQEPGAVRSIWQAFDPEGRPFGDPIYLEIVVK